MPRPRLIVTRRWPREVEAVLAETFDAVLNEADEPFGPDRLSAALDDCDALLPTVTDKLGADILTGGHRAKVIGNFGVGFNHIDIDAAKAAGLVVTNTPGVLTDATADIALTLLLNVARRSWEAEEMLRAGEWAGWCPTQLMGTAPQGKTLGIVGMGRIGKAMARRCHGALDMKIVFHNRSPVADAGVPATQLGSVEEVLETADFVSLHCPGGGENTHLINAERLRRMKPTAFLINTARGDVVDEAALTEALEAGTIAGAGLDVYAREPHVGAALRAMKNLTLFPHLGSATRETRIAMGMKVVENVTAFFEGREPPDRVA